jgi:cell division septation protein DedD
MNEDRRQHPRIIPDSALLVSLGHSKRGFLADLSEGGIAFDGFPPKGGNHVIFLAFDLPDGAGSIEAIGEVVWTCDSIHRTGVRFLELADASRRRLGRWISSRVFERPGTEKGAPEDTSVRESDASLAATRATEFPLIPPPTFRQRLQLDTATEPVFFRSAQEQEWDRHESTASREAVANQFKRRHNSPPSYIGTILAIVFVSSACVSLGYYLPSLINTGKARSAANMSISPIPRSNNNAVSSVAQPAAIKPASVSSSVAESKPLPAQSPEVAAFVLQVAAMSHRENAEALVQKLQQKHFPAFISSGGERDLYRVDVGPYPNAEYARSAQNDLKSAGFHVLLQHRGSASASN